MTEFILGGNVFLSVILSSQVSGKERKKNIPVARFLSIRQPLDYWLAPASLNLLPQPPQPRSAQPSHTTTLALSSLLLLENLGARWTSPSTENRERERDREGKKKKKKNVTRKNSKHLAHHFPSTKFRPGGGAARRLAAYGGSWRLLD